MDEEIPPENIDVVDTRPLEERIGDKNWKARQSAYDDLKKLVSEEGSNTAIYSEYVSWLPKMTSDTNASALDSGLDAAVAFIDTASDGVCQPYYDKMFSNIVDKTFSGRASTLSKGKTLMHKMMEVDDANACTAFLLTKLADKKPKVPPTSIDMIKEGIEMFGVKAFPVKDIIKALPAVFNGSNSAARDSAMALIVEIYRWIRQAPLQGLLDSLRSAQKSDFERIVAEKADEFSASSPKPSLYLRKERPAPGSAHTIEGKRNDTATSSSKSSGAAAAAPGNDGLDSREYVEEVDLMKKLKGSDYAALLANEKWSEQLRGLQMVIDAIGPVPKIKAGNDVHDLVAVIKGFLRQGHLQLQVNSLKILCLLADGMRSSFGSTVRPIMQQVVQKCKEKRLVPEVQAVLQMVFSHCLSYDCINEDVIEFVNNKKSPPHGKVGLMDVVSQTCMVLPEKVASDSLKPLASALVAETEDSDPKVREASITALAAIGLLAKSRGRLAADALKVIMATENTLPKIFKRIQAAMDGGGQSALSATTGSISLDAVKPKPSASEPASSVPVVKKSVGSALNKTTSSLSSGASGAAKKPAGVSSSVAPRKASAAVSASIAADDDQTEDLMLSPEEAIAQLAAMEIPKWVPETGLPGMDSVKWQEKVDALSTIERRLTELQQNGGSAQFSAALVKYLSATSSGFKINNINILKATIQTCAAIVNSGSAGGGKFNRAAAWEILKHLGDKIADRKSKDAVQALLTALGEATSVGFVVKRMRALLDKCISPLAHQYYLEWLKEAIGEFGCAAFPVPQIGNFCQAEMENKNANVRTAAVEVMGALFHQVGPRLAAIAFSDDMKPQLKALMEAEFAKVGHDPTAAAKAPRAVIVAATSVSGGSGGANSALGGIPRQDLCSMLDKNIIAELNFVDGKTSWQRRKAAMETIIVSCERSAHFLEANKPTGEVVKALKPRMSDTQANLKPVAVSAIGHIVASLDTRTAGPKVLQSMAQAMMLGLGDNKKPMRDSTITALQHAVSGQLSDGEGATLAPADPGMLMAILPAAAESLVNVVGRLELLAWLLHHTDSLKGDCTELVNPLVLTLQDKNAAVRASGEQLLTTLMANSLCSKSTLDKATRDLPPATKRSIQAVVDRSMAAHGTAQPKVTSTDNSAATSTRANLVTSAVEIPPSPPRKINSETGNVPSPPRAPTETCTSPVVLPSAKQPMSTVNSIGTPVHAGSGHCAPTPTTVFSTQWLLKRNAAGKLRRAEEAQRLNWPQPPDAPSEMEIAALKVVWRPIVTPDLAFLLFPIVRPGSPVNQDVYMPAINELNSQLLCPFLLHHTEFLLRWICIVLCLKHESGPGLLRLLQLICDLFEAIHRDDPSHSALNDAEVSCILPHLVDRCGHRSERHQALFRHAITLMGQLVSPSKMVHALLQGLKSHNKRSRGICLEELQRIVETEGASVMSASSLKEVTAFLEARDCDVTGRGACLDLVFAVFIALDKDAIKLKKLLGVDISDSVLDLVEQRLERHHRKEMQEQADACVVADQIPPTVALPPVTSAASAEKMAAQVEEVLRGTVNSDVWALTSEDASAVLSPKSEMRSHMMMLNSEMSSTPVTEDYCREQMISDEKNVETSKETTPVPAGMGSVECMTDNAGTPLADPSSARRKSVLDGEDAEEGAEGDTVGALPSEFRSPAPPVRRTSSRLSMSASKGVLGGDESPMVLELNGLYLDIENKVDALLNTAHAVAASDSLQEECKDYLKMLHSIVNGEWSAEKLPEDEAVLLLHAEPLVRRLCGCIARAFDLPVLDHQSSAASNAIQGVDVSLLAISLSVLFSMVKRPEVTAKLSEDALFEVFHECLHRICDVRITQMAQQSDALGLESKETAQQVARALNNIVLKLGLGGETGTVLLAMLRVMFCCIPAAEVPHYADHRPLPTSSTKPASRLVIQILSEHGSSAVPYSESEVPLRPLLEGIHSFFTRHPTSTSNDTPFRTVKTILNEIVLVKGGESVLGALHETSIPRSAFIYLLTCRLGNVQPQPVESSGDLNAQIVAVIEDITSSRDKVGAIKELHRLKLANPQVDINHYLQKISAAFRRYVLNTLAKLDASNADDSENNVAHFNENRETAGSDLPEKKTPLKPTTVPLRSDTPAAADYASARSTPMSHSHLNAPSHCTSSTHKSRLPTPSVHSHHHVSVGNDSNASVGLRLDDPASEAMRILEGIKARPSKIAPLGDPSGASNTLARNYSLEYGGQDTGSSRRTSVPPSGKHPETTADSNASSMTPAGKQKRFAFNPETKRMEVVMVNSADASPGSSPTGLMTGDSSPFARRNDIIRNSLSSLTASLEMQRSTLPSATTANTQN